MGGIRKDRLLQTNNSFQDPKATWDVRKQCGKAEQLWEMPDIPAKGLASGAGHGPLTPETDLRTTHARSGSPSLTEKDASLSNQEAV